MDTWILILMNKVLELKSSIIASIALAGVILGAILAFGGFSPLFSGFARQSYVLSLNQKLTTRIERLSTQADMNYVAIRKEQRVHWAQDTAASLLRLDLQKCRLPPGRLRNMYDQQIQDEMDSYYKYTGQYYPLPSCRNL